MVVGSGVDLIEVARVAQAIRRFGGRFERRTFAPGEIRDCRARRDPAAHFAARFAAKEAAMKALGTGWRKGIRFRDIEVVRGAGGSHALRFHGESGRRAAALGSSAAHVSLCRSPTWAGACVLLEDNGAGS